MRGSTSLLCFPFADVRSMRVIASFRPQEMKIYPVSPIQRYCLLVSGRKNYGADMNVGACLYFPVDLDSSIVINRVSKCLAFHPALNARFEISQDECIYQSIDDTDNFRSEEHTSELQSLMRNSYAVFCLKKKK